MPPRYVENCATDIPVCGSCLKNTQTRMSAPHYVHEYGVGADFQPAIHPSQSNPRVADPGLAMGRGVAPRTLKTHRISCSAKLLKPETSRSLNLRRELCRELCRFLSSKTRQGSRRSSRRSLGNWFRTRTPTRTRSSLPTRHLNP